MSDISMVKEGQVKERGLITYLLDRDDIIIEVSQAWNSFAISNNADKNTLADSVIGHNIFSFILGDSTRMYMQVLLQQARILGHSPSRKYRCDSPELKRYMQMLLIPEPDGVVRVEHTLERVESFEQPISFSPAVVTNPSTVFRCSICARLKIGSVWIFPEDALDQEHIPCDTVIPVRYLVCPLCDNPLKKGIT